MTRPALLLLALAAAAGCRDARQITAVDADLAVVVDGSNAFAVDLYQEAALEDGNLFISPFSITSALSMVYAGAEGETEAQIAAAMGVGDEALWHENLGALADDLMGNHHRAYTLSGANRVWAQDDLALGADFETVLDEDYLAPVERTDFAGDAAGALHDVNKWVSRQTHGYIPELFQAGDIDASTVVVLCNAIFFEAEWAEAFEEDSTTDREFRTPDGAVQVPTMFHHGEGYEVAHEDGLTVLSLPYEEEELDMVVLLPEDDDGLADLEADLSAEILAGYLAALSPAGEVDVYLPRFTMDYELPLQATLEALGIVDMFQPGAADLTGMIPGADTFVGAARHKAYVEVFEEGTRAAAATGFGVNLSAAPESEEVRVDHPFLFLLRDRLTDTILFIGRVEDPR
ncbi:MAG: serpin family protein [Pseudomonadota bacterium]